MADNDRALLVMLDEKPSDDELRSLHDFLSGHDVAVEHLRRCTTCGFIVDVSYEAEFTQ